MLRMTMPAFIVAAVLAGCGPTMPTRVGPPIPKTGPAVPFVHSTGIKFVALPVGRIENEDYSLELLRPVLMSAHEVTNAQYEKFAPGRKRASSSPDDDQPVANVTAKECEEFCKWLTKNDALGRKYRLPGVAEWEYAARCGKADLKYPWGNVIDPSKACYGAKATKPVGSYPPNSFGLYDMAGNVAEWTWTDDFPPYLLRGGSWSDDASELAIAKAGKLPEERETLDHHGIRVVCEPPLMR